MARLYSVQASRCSAFAAVAATSPSPPTTSPRPPTTAKERVIPRTYRKKSSSVDRVEPERLLGGANGLALVTSIAMGNCHDNHEAEYDEQAQGYAQEYRANYNPRSLLQLGQQRELGARWSRWRRVRIHRWLSRLSFGPNGHGLKPSAESHQMTLSSPAGNSSSPI